MKTLRLQLTRTMLSNPKPPFCVAEIKFSTLARAILCGLVCTLFLALASSASTPPAGGGGGPSTGSASDLRYKTMKP